MSFTKSYAQLHFIVLLWGFTAILGLLITIPVVEMVFYRTLLAAIALAGLMYLKRKTFKIGRNEIFKILGTGILFAIHWILFFLSARVSNASVSLVGFATATFWTSLFEPIMTKSRIKFYEVILGLIVLTGIYIIFQAEFDHILGLALAIGCAFIYAIFGVLNKKFIRRHNHYTITFYEMSGAVISIVLFFPFYLEFVAEDSTLHLNPAAMDWLYLAVLSFVCTVYTFSTATKLMKRLSAYSVNLVVNMEPIYGIILAVIIFGESERMGLGFYAGALIIIISVLAYPVINRYREKGVLPLDKLR